MRDKIHSTNVCRDVMLSGFVLSYSVFLSDEEVENLLASHPWVWPPVSSSLSSMTDWRPLHDIVLALRGTDIIVGPLTPDVLTEDEHIAVLRADVPSGMSDEVLYATHARLGEEMANRRALAILEYQKDVASIVSS